MNIRISPCTENRYVDFLWTSCPQKWLKTIWYTNVVNEKGSWNQLQLNHETKRTYRTSSLDVLCVEYTIEKKKDDN